MVFCCNSGLVIGNKVYLSKFRHKERTGEQRHYAKWFKENGFKLLGEDYPEYFEGGGDCVFSDYDTLWAGFGQRTSKQVSIMVLDKNIQSQTNNCSNVLNALSDSHKFSSL